MKNLILYILAGIVVGSIVLGAMDTTFQPSTKEICLLIAGGLIGVLTPKKDDQQPPTE